MNLLRCVSCGHEQHEHGVVSGACMIALCECRGFQRASFEARKKPTPRRRLSHVELLCWSEALVAYDRAGTVAFQMHIAERRGRLGREEVFTKLFVVGAYDVASLERDEKTGLTLDEVLGWWRAGVEQHNLVWNEQTSLLRYVHVRGLLVEAWELSERTEKLAKALGRARPVWLNTVHCASCVDSFEVMKADLVHERPSVLTELKERLDALTAREGGG